MINMNLLRRCVLGGILVVGFGVAGCSSNKPPATSSQQTASDLGVLSRVEDPAAVAAVRTFYVAPNTQPSMSDSFVTGTPLQQAFADEIANKLTARGLIQAPQDMADATVVFTVHTPKPPPASALNSPAEGLGYADQLLSDADAMQTRDNFLQNDRVDMRIKMMDAKTEKVIWRGSIAGVQAANEDTRGHMLDMLSAVDELIKKYPQVNK